MVYAYGGRSAAQCRDKHQTVLFRLTNLTVMNLPWEGTRALATLASPNITLQCTVQEGQVWLANGSNNVQLEMDCSNQWMV
ncbi:MAG: YaeQ family protein [Nitrospiraceae bacterium]